MRRIDIEKKKRIEMIKEYIIKNPEISDKDLEMLVMQKFGVCSKTAKENIGFCKWEIKNG